MLSERHSRKRAGQRSTQSSDAKRRREATTRATPKRSGATRGDAPKDPVRTLSAKSRAKQADIIAAAREVFIDEGFAAMTLRRVADEIGISKGNLTYHFPTKDGLLAAVIDDFLARYESSFEQANLAADAASRVRAYFEFLVADAQDPNSQRFFYQLWALAPHQPGLAGFRDRVYEHFLARVRAELRFARPDLDAKARRRKEFLLMSCIEGFNVLFGTTPQFRRRFGALDDGLLEELLGIVFDRGTP